MKITVISDTHRKTPSEVPDGDLLIHAGDFLYARTDGYVEAKAAIDWFSDLPHKNKVAIPGNHDFFFQNNPQSALRYNEKGDTVVIINEMREIEGIKIYGSPNTPRFGDWAFYYGRHQADWSHIPDDTQILITHGPPYEILDRTNRGVRAGCTALRERIRELKDLKLHVFGHIHEGYGIIERDGVIFANASYCGMPYADVNVVQSFYLEF